MLRAPANDCRQSVLVLGADLQERRVVASASQAAMMLKANVTSEQLVQQAHEILTQNG
jgi:hypothetical protein